MNKVAKKFKLGMAGLLSIGAALLVIVGVQSQDKNYSVSKNVSNLVSSCWGTKVANAQDGGDGSGAYWLYSQYNSGGCSDPWASGGWNGGDGDGDACGDASPDGPDCGPR